jgi:hypothetical protein
MLITVVAIVAPLLHAQNRCREGQPMRDTPRA